VTVDIPPGALDGNVTITVAPTTTPASGGVGTAYEIGPMGTQFKSPVKMTFKYAGASLGGHTVTDLRAGTVVDGAWQALDTNATDPTSQTVSGTTMHLSVYGVFYAGSSGQVCVNVHGGCNGSGPAGGPSCTSYPTCTNPKNGLGALPCDAYPASTQTSCSNVTDGIDVTCCFPPGTPSCIKATDGCSSSSTGGGCTPPSCDQICGAKLPGSTTQSCAAGSNSNTAVCCLPAGSSLPTGTSGSDAGTSPTDASTQPPDSAAPSCTPTTAACPTPQPDAYDCPNTAHPAAQCSFFASGDAGDSIFCCVPSDAGL
jgi:hypothetical protein